MTFLAWPEIESFHNVRKYTKQNPEILNGNSKVTYKAKVKLHGTNAAVQCHRDGRIVAQSRTTELTVENDNAGFAKWVKSNEALWQDTRNNVRQNVIIYGEWIGPGIQKGVAVSEIPQRSFVVFAARPLANGAPYGDSLLVDPEVLEGLIDGIPDAYVLPWQSESIEVDFSKTAEELAVGLAIVNLWVALVEKEDPWVNEVFGVKGTGEGLVFYPVSNDHLGMTNFNNLVFKAKGEKHKNIKTAAPVQVDAQSATNVNQFVDMVLTNARLEQGAMAVQPDPVVVQLAFDMKLIGKFIAWVVADVQKETQDELEASKLEWKQVQKPVGDRARAWYIEQVKKS